MLRHSGGIYRLDGWTRGCRCPRVDRWRHLDPKQEDGAEDRLVLGDTSMSDMRKRAQQDMTITQGPWLHRKLNRLGWRLLLHASRRSPVPFYSEWGQRLLWRYPVPLIKGRENGPWAHRNRLIQR